MQKLLQALQHFQTNILVSKHGLFERFSQPKFKPHRWVYKINTAAYSASLGNLKFS